MFDTKNIALFAILGSIGAFWSQIRGFITKFFSFFIRTDEIEHYETAANLIRLLLKEGRIIRWGNITYKTGYREWLKKFECSYDYLFLYKKEFLIKYKKTFIFVKSENGKSLKVTYLFGTFNLEKLINKAYLEGVGGAKEWQKKAHKRFYICERGGSSGFPKGDIESKGAQMSPAPTADSSSESLFSNYQFLKENNKYIQIQYDDIGRLEDAGKNSTYYWQKEGLQLKNEVEFWLKNRKWFEDRGLRWYRGAICAGGVGCGKSKAVLEVAKAVDVPLFRFDISTMSNEEFTKEWNSTEYGSIILIEDICSIWNKRENVHAKAGMHKQLLTFDHFINVINGVRETSGIFLVLTANHPEKLDAAITRAGRVDAKIDFGPLDKEGREFIASNILQDWPLEKQKIVLDGEGLSVVEFQNKVVERAIELFNLNNKIV